MCFSAEASFTAFGVLTVMGTVSIVRARRLGFGAGKTFLSAFPLFFGIQQGFEGLVWLAINGAVPVSWHLPATMGFLFFAVGFWPAAGPLAGWMIETKPRRKKLFLPFVAAGFAVAGVLFAAAVMDPLAPVSLEKYQGHLVYLAHLKIPHGTEYVYFVTASAALVGSSDRMTKVFGLVLAASFIATLMLYQAAVLASVWCFFAAWCSLVLLAFQRPERNADAGPAGPAGAAPA
ncbi:DUF6629 family protein [Rhodovulum sp. DZ06]|uniref:DUF6629 family protein n=1 Tax=Rhodovulum sp. DZ06 TaxID=3425126 RepID=UPI003D351C5B